MALVLTRRVGETLVIGDPSSPIGRITISSVHGDKVNMVFDFPRQIQVNREEVAIAKAKGLAVGQVKP